MNYAELTSQIQDQLEYAETNFVAAIPNFIKRAEERIYRMVQIPDLRKIATSTLTASDEYLSTPDDYLATYSLGVISSGDLTFLQEKEYEFIREAYPASTTEGLPRFYATVDDAAFILAPTPDSTYSVELFYYFLPNSIVDDSTTWLGDNAGNALFWGSIIEAYKYMKGEQELMNVYEASFAEAIAELKMLCEGRNRRTTYREPNLRMPV